MCPCTLDLSWLGDCLGCCSDLGGCCGSCGDICSGCGDNLVGCCELFFECLSGLLSWFLFPAKKNSLLGHHLVYSCAFKLASGCRKSVSLPWVILGMCQIIVQAWTSMYQKLEIGPFFARVSAERFLLESWLQIWHPTQAGERLWFYDVELCTWKLGCSEHNLLDREQGCNKIGHGILV